jgi:hypothetical protein
LALQVDFPAPSIAEARNPDNNLATIDITQLFGSLDFGVPAGDRLPGGKLVSGSGFAIAVNSTLENFGGNLER